MARAMTLLLGLVWLLTTGAFANSCSSYKYKFAVEWASNNRYAREFCSSLPPSRSYNKDKAPDVLRNCIYTDVTTICACVNDKCKLPKCLSPKTVCKQDCGGYCAELKASDDNNCGSCGNKCSSGLKCVSGECKTACTAGSELCNGACKVKSSYTTDNENCGACKNKCTSPKPYCTNSQRVECTKNGQCGSGKKCSSNKCVPECTKTADCSGGKVCGATGACEFECSLTKVCPNGKTCNSNGVSEPESSATKPCTAPKVCGLFSGVCEFECTDTKACTDSTTTCKNNKCVPKVCSPLNLAGTCEDGKLCSSAGVCEYECSGTKTCSDSTKTCKNNKSVPKVCSPLNLEGTFEDGKVCSSAGACEFGCSDTKACTDSTKTCKSNICVPKVCSLQNPEGTCEDGKICSSAGVCKFECSNNEPCFDLAYTCKNNKCVPKVCSPQNKEGTCDGEDQVCSTEGQCIEDLAKQCSPTNKMGKCPNGQGCDPVVGECRQKCTTLGAIEQCGFDSGQVCDGTLCQQQPTECSVLNKRGSCSSQQQTCVQGECKEICRTGFPTGVCLDSTKQCINEQCQLPCSATNPTGACADRDATCSSSGQCQSSAVPRNGGFETPGGSPDTAAHWILQTALRRASTGAERANRAPSGNYFVSLYCASEAGRPNFPSSYDPQTPVASLNQAIPAGTPGGQFYSVSGKAAVVQITNAGCELFVDFGTRNADIGGFAYFDQVTEGTDYAPLYGEFYLYDTTTAITPLVIRMICTPTDTTSSFDAILNLDDIKIELAPYVP